MAKKIVVIGGGISGLTAGIYALQAGFDVEIYESHNVAGGMCAQWQRKGSECTSAIHWMMGAQDNSDLNEIWKTTGAIDQNTEIFVLDYISACPNEDKYSYLHADISRLEEELLQLSPIDESSIKELISEIKIHRRLPIPASKPMDLMEPMEKAIAFAPYIKAEKQSSLKNISIAEYVERFQSSVIRNLLLSVVPNSRISTDTLMIWLAASCNSNTTFPCDGFFAMAKRMEKKFLSLGGKIYFNSKVEKINVSNGVATSIALANGKEIQADYIIPTISPDVLLKKLLNNQFKDIYFEQRFESPNSFFTPALTLLNLSVNADVSKLPHTLVLEPHNPLFINKTEIQYLKINHYSFAPDFCKGGKTLMQVVLQEQEFEYWKKLKATSSADYQQAKNNLAAKVIEEIEIVYPEIKGKIELLDVATPLTLQRYCHSYKGAYLSFCAMNEVRRENHIGTIFEVNNLYLAGQWALQDGGLPMAAVAGKFAVQRICNQENNNNINSK